MHTFPIFKVVKRSRTPDIFTHVTARVWQQVWDGEVTLSERTADSLRLAWTQEIDQTKRHECCREMRFVLATKRTYCFWKRRHRARERGDCRVVRVPRHSNSRGAELRWHQGGVMQVVMSAACSLWQNLTWEVAPWIRGTQRQRPVKGSILSEKETSQVRERELIHPLYPASQEEWLQIKQLSHLLPISHCIYLLSSLSSF